METNYSFKIESNLWELEIYIKDVKKKSKALKKSLKKIADFKVKMDFDTKKDKINPTLETREEANQAVENMIKVLDDILKKTSLNN